ncbi:hypothetical protein L210DRAFT_3481073 [Boletus edulis BED1]|uniref:Uncharacterized protein n=1 Tax=Boletus edulis BED1 TaxID=1328754 RepID=A0AAD4GE68_BOLED|nr:hypothetical protein L210DRAFT_3481073 [Boletus edulis BED1]
MAGVLAGAARRCVPIHTSCISRCPVLVKQIHVSQPTRRASEGGDLLGIPDAVPQITPQRSTKPLPKYSNSRERQFHEYLQFVRDRTGRVKVVKAGQVRATAWLRLFQLASKAEHLEAVVEVFPQWKESGKSFTSLDAEMFVRRCEELDCPLLALKVFGDHPKYSLAFSSFPAARNLIHSLYQKYPLENVIAAVSLFGLNNLSPVTEDPASSAMLYAACLRSKNKHASLLGRDIRVALQKLLGETESYPERKEKILRARHSNKPDIWLLEALRDIKKSKSDEGRGSWWITEWMARGEGRVLPPLAERRYQARGGKHLQDASVTPATRSAPQQVQYA